MKVRLLCEIEAEIIDKEELESMEDNKKSRFALRCVEKIWKDNIREKLKDICPSPIYDNRTLNIKVEYADEEKEFQQFQLGDTAYMIDEDYRFFESEVKRIDLDKGKYFYTTNDADFEFKDIGDWVFTSEMYRELHLEAMIL